MWLLSSFLNTFSQIVVAIFACISGCKRWIHHFCQVTSANDSIECIPMPPNHGTSLSSYVAVFCSAPLASLSIEYSTTPYEEDEVNSPPPNLRVVRAASPSPLKPRHVTGSPCIIGGRAMKGRRIVYDAKAQPAIVHHSLVSASPAPSPIALSWRICSIRLHLGSS